MWRILGNKCCHDITKDIAFPVEVKSNKCWWILFSLSLVLFLFGAVTMQYTIGNLIGYNIFNLLAVLGITTFIKEINIIDAKIFTSDYMRMISITLKVGLFILFSKSQISRKAGVVLWLFYISYFIFFKLKINNLLIK